MNYLEEDTFKLKSELWRYLFEFAKLEAIGKYISIKTRELGKIVGKSQQSVSRHLIYLEVNKFIKRRYHKKETLITLTERGELLIRRIYNELYIIFSRTVGHLNNLAKKDNLTQKKIDWLRLYTKDPILGFTREQFDKNFPQVSSFYNSIEWKECRIRILKRDNYTCQICDKKPSRQVHHINSPVYCPELCLDPKNLIVLCDDCHNEWHQK